MKIGLFFGSFNPIHTGHLAIASYMVEFTDIDKVWFVVSPHNPLKSKELLLDDFLRLEMVKLAIATDPRFEASDVEFSLSQPSFTYNTLQHLQKLHPSLTFTIVMGSDGLVMFDKWKNHLEIIAHFERYIYPRPNTPGSFLENLTNARLVNAPLMEISSTFIRDAIASKKNVRYFVPDTVWNFIVSKKLYALY